MKIKSCEHLDNFDYTQRKTPKSYECMECIQTGDTWVHLRTCQECGITLCCDSSKNKHATLHFQSHQHALVISAEPGEQWAWCYSDQLFKKYE